MAKNTTNTPKTPVIGARPGCCCGDGCQCGDDCRCGRGCGCGSAHAGA